MTERAASSSEKSRLRRWRMAGIFTAVAVTEIGLFLLLGQVRGPKATPVIDPQPFEVILYDPPPPISPDPPAPKAGGGAPAAPATIHTPPPPPERRPPELPAPPAKAPESAPVVGIAPTPSVEPGFGQGGQGTGSGSGSGSGTGPGSGSTGPRIVTGPTIGQIRSLHPANARSRYGRVELSCVIRLDSRLEACRVEEEAPAGMGFGAAGLQVAGYFRFQPPTENGRPIEGQRVTVGVDFGRPPR